MNDCFICNKHAGKIETAGHVIYENDYVYVGHIDRNGNPNYLGHIMIDLKRHVPTLAEMTVDEAQAFGLTMAKVSNKGIGKCRACICICFRRCRSTFTYALSRSLPEHTERTLGAYGRI